MRTVYSPIPFVPALPTLGTVLSLDVFLFMTNSEQVFHFGKSKQVRMRNLHAFVLVLLLRCYTERREACCGRGWLAVPMGWDVLVG